MRKTNVPKRRAQRLKVFTAFSILCHHYQWLSMFRFLVVELKRCPYAQDTTETKTEKQEFSFDSVVLQEGIAARFSNVGRYSEFSACFHLSIFVISTCDFFDFPELKIFVL